MEQSINGDTEMRINNDRENSIIKTDEDLEQIIINTVENNI